MEKKTGPVTVTIRLIRSFEYRNIKTIILRDLSLDTTVKDLATRVNNEIQTSTTLLPPFKKHKYDCLKIHSYAHRAKTGDTAINLDHEEWILDPEKTLAESNICNETEISYFVREEYERYKQNPRMLW